MSAKQIITALFIAAVVITLISIVKELAEGIYLQGRADYIQEICDQYEDYRLCPLLQ